MALIRCFLILVAAAHVVGTRDAAAQALTGSLIGTVRDEHGGALVGARVRLTSPSLLGGAQTLTTDQRGQIRFLTLPPGSYTLDVELPKFSTYHEENIRIGIGATIERPIALQLAGVAGSVIVEGQGSRIDARDPGFGTRFGADDLRAIPTRRASMFDFIRAAPGVSPTSPGSGTSTTVSTFGSGTNENQFLIDGTNFTCPCSGIARAEPGVDFIQEIHLQSVGASAEFGNVQGAVINVVTRQGSDRFLSDASYFGQTAAMTSRPVRLAIPGTIDRDSGYERARYRDLTTNLGGPLVRSHAWFFAGYQYLRDHDSQPGSDPRFPRTYEQNKLFGKLTWQMTPGLRLVQSVHQERWLNPDAPTIARPFEATNRSHGSVPAVTFGDLTHTLSSSTYWDLRVGRFVFSSHNPPSTSDRATPSRFDQATGVTSGAPPSFFDLRIVRTTAKATLNHYRTGLFGTTHHWKAGAQIERGGHEASIVTPGGVRYTDLRSQPFQSISRAPSIQGGLFITAAGFASNAIALGDRATINAGIRFDHSRAISQAVHAVDSEGFKTEAIIQGAGTLYTWNIFSPRLGVTAKLTADGRAVMRASYGRFSQGMLTAEWESIHPALMPVVTREFVPADGSYTRVVSVVDSRSFQIDSKTRAPRTDEYSIGVDREIGLGLTVATAYIRKNGANFIGWTEVGGQYERRTHSLTDGRTLPVLALLNRTGDRRFLLTNPAGYSLTYNGLVMAVERRRAQGWHAFGSYAFSRASGLQAASGVTAGGAQVSTVVPPGAVTFGRDPNDLTNAHGRLPNDRPHIVRVMGSLVVPRTGMVFAANFQRFSGKPWAASTQVGLPQGSQRILLEPRGSRRLSSQSLLDLRVSRTISTGRTGRIELLIDVLNALNDTAEESIVTDNFFSSNFGAPSVFMDPRRAMLGVRVNLGQ